MTNEIWHKCEVPYTRYEVSNQGRVRNAHTDQVLRPYDQSCGYLQVGLFYKGQRRICNVHTLVATAFVEGWREGLQVNHKNGVKTDNRAENLEWVTASENRQHARDVLLLDVKPVALLDERGHLQWLFNSSQACDRAFGCCVRKAILRKHRYHGYRPLYISVPMYREIVHLVAVQHYTLHSAWVEACALSADESPSGGSFSDKLRKRQSRAQSRCARSNGSNGNPAVGADSRVCPNNMQPAAQTGKGNQNYQLLEQREPKMLASIWPSRDKSHGTKLHNYQLSDEG